MSEKKEFPKEVKFVLSKLKENDFEAFVVGGSVRDIILGKIPLDWDITTNAKPEEIQKIFPRSFYENDFGMVTVIFEEPSVPETRTIEVTTYRIDYSYSDARHPDKIAFAENLKKDLARRDFTINAIAMDDNLNVIDPYKGQADLKNKVIRTVGSADSRFSEDALRMMRAIRFAVQLDFKLDDVDTNDKLSTFSAIQKDAYKIQKISAERIRDEFTKIIMSKHPEVGLYLLERSGLLKYIIPELQEGIGIDQNKNHIFTVYDHAVRALAVAAKRKYSRNVRLAALFHDIGKPKTKEGKGYNATFYNHEILGERMARKILTRLRYPKETVERVARLVRNHMFYYEMDKTTDSAIRRMLRKIGPDNLDEQIDLRVSDRLGMGRPKAIPYRLRILIQKFRDVQKDPITVKMLKINGNDIMKLLNIKPSPKLGFILDALLSEVLHDPKKNTKKELESLAKKYNKMDNKELLKLSPDIEMYEEKRKKNPDYEKALGLK